MELDSSELLKRFVAAGVGIGFIARSSAAEDLRAGTLATVPLDAPVIPRDLALVFRKRQGAQPRCPRLHRHRRSPQGRAALR